MNGFNEIMKGGIRKQAFLPGLLLWSVLLPACGFAAPFDCKTNRCGIAIDAPYPNLAVGTIDGIATAAQAKVVLYDAHRLGLWHIFPPDSASFIAQIQLVSISIKGKSMTVLIGTDEAQASDFQIGELARFAPHRGFREPPRPNDPYWIGDGCLALLCIPGDSVCRQQYLPGLYRVKDGAELDASGRQVVPGGAIIDPMSMRLKSKSH